MQVEINLSELRIVADSDLTKRAYVTFYFNGVRVREYNGNNVGQRINPNRAKSITERNQLLLKLQFELYTALKTNIYPHQCGVGDSENHVEAIAKHSKPLKDNGEAGKLLEQALNKKLNSQLSKTYKRDLKSVHRDFSSFALPSELSGQLEDITTARVEEFLSQYGSSGTYYMNKRRTLGILFAVAGRLIDKSIKSVKTTERRRTKAKLHVAYDREQIKPILEFLKDKYPKLHVCCLLTYGAWLRPHEEVRLLVPANFKNHLTEIHLSGDENKGGKVRVVYVPDYVRIFVEPLISGLHLEDNIFTGKSFPLNESYFNTQWSRAYKKMFELGLIRKNQTIYSFRHTAAVETYRKTKDVYLLQKLLGHSSIVVTLKYLRSLGEFNTEELKNAAPTLD